MLKPGVTTSEFIVLIASIVGSVTASLANVMDPKYAVALSVVSGIAYMLSRGMAKSAPQATPNVMPIQNVESMKIVDSAQTPTK